MFTAYQAAAPRASANRTAAIAGGSRDAAVMEPAHREQLFDVPWIEQPDRMIVVGDQHGAPVGRQPAEHGAEVLAGVRGREPPVHDLTHRLAAIVLMQDRRDLACADGLLFSDGNCSSPFAIGLRVHHYARRHNCVRFSRSRSIDKPYPGLAFPSDGQLDRECRRPELQRTWFATVSRQLRCSQRLHLFDRIERSHRAASIDTQHASL